MSESNWTGLINEMLDISLYLFNLKMKKKCFHFSEEIALFTGRVFVTQVRLSFQYEMKSLHRVYVNCFHDGMSLFCKERTLKGTCEEQSIRLAWHRYYELLYW